MRQTKSRFLSIFCSLTNCPLLLPVAQLWLRPFVFRFRLSLPLLSS
jgi:hypothetical protein